MEGTKSVNAVAAIFNPIKSKQNRELLENKWKQIKQDHINAATQAEQNHIEVEEPAMVAAAAQAEKDWLQLKQQRRQPERRSRRNPRRMQS